LELNVEAQYAERKAENGGLGTLLSYRVVRDAHCAHSRVLELCPFRHYCSKQALGGNKNK
jgi:hypothetical protein